MDSQDKGNYRGVLSFFSHISLRSRPGAAMHWLTGWEKHCETSLFGSREVMGLAMQPAGSHPDNELCSLSPGDVQSPHIGVKVFSGKLRIRERTQPRVQKPPRCSPALAGGRIPATTLLPASKGRAGGKTIRLHIYFAALS